MCYEELSLSMAQRRQQTLPAAPVVLMLHAVGCPFFAYFLSFNEKQVAGRGETRRFFLAKMARNRIVVRYNSMLCGRIESL
jgi:hypothetical protein